MLVMVTGTVFVSLIALVGCQYLSLSFKIRLLSEGYIASISSVKSFKMTPLTSAKAWSQVQIRHCPSITTHHHPRLMKPFIAHEARLAADMRRRITNHSGNRRNKQSCGQDDFHVHQPHKLCHAAGHCTVIGLA